MSKCEECLCISCVNACTDICKECKRVEPAPVKWCRDHSRQLTIFDYLKQEEDES